MIALMRIIQDEFKEIGIKDCTISELSDEINYLTPAVVLSPISEEWTFNLLGNQNDKEVKFKIYYYDDHIEGNYDNEIDDIINKIKNVLNTEKVIDEVANFNSTVINISLEEENTKICVVANISLKLCRR